MKVLFVSTTDIVGGASRATCWLARGLRNSQHEVSMCVQQKFSDYSWVSRVDRTRTQKLFEAIRTRLEPQPLRFYEKNSRGMWSLNLLQNPGLKSAILKEKPDIVNLHWVGEGFVPISMLRQIHVPIVWSLYDMWPFTGGCHYAGECGRYVVSCGKCPQLESTNFDVSSFVMNTKKNKWSNIPLTIVAPSNWLAAEARKSSLFANQRIEVIPHGTDVDVFRPIEKQLAKAIIGVDQSRRHVLFGATGGLNDIRKGFNYLKEAMQRLALKPGYEDLTLLVFGSSGSDVSSNMGFPIHYLGKLHDDVSLAIVYSAADVTVTPSMQEAFGMTASESMCCGTPVVAFGITGPLDVIDHKIDGYLATPYDAEDFAKGISWVLDVSRAAELKNSARIKGLKNFDLRVVANKYSKLYSEIIFTRNI